MGLFYRNPPTVPRWPRWIETPDSITIKARILTAGSVGMFFCCAWVLPIGGAQALGGIASTHALVNNFCTTTLGLPAWFDWPYIVGTAAGTLLNFVLLPTLLLFFPGRVVLKFYNDRIEVKGLLSWANYPRSSVKRIRFVTRHVKTAADENDLFRVVMLFGKFNQVALITTTSVKKARNFKMMCAAAEAMSKSKFLRAFPVDAIAPTSPHEPEQRG